LGNVVVPPDEKSMTERTVMDVPEGWFPCGLTVTEERENAETQAVIPTKSKKITGKNLYR
jgi:hypothetical protein